MANPPPDWGWYHGDGVLCCGGLRVAREDFDTDLPEECRRKVFDHICATLNAPTAPDEDLEGLSVADREAVIEEYARAAVFKFEWGWEEVAE